MREHGQALEGDLRRYYGVELSDVVRGRLSWRKLRSYVSALPPSSATTRSVLGDEALWGLPELLLAGMFDVLNAANWQRAGGKGSKPKRIPRPGATSGAKYGKTQRPVEEIKAFLNQFKPLPEEEPYGG